MPSRNSRARRPHFRRTSGLARRSRRIDQKPSFPAETTEFPRSRRTPNHRWPGSRRICWRWLNDDHLPKLGAPEAIVGGKEEHSACKDEPGGGRTASKSNVFDELSTVLAAVAVPQLLPELLP